MRVKNDLNLRLSALAEYEILDTAAEPEFDRLTKIASLICEAPISLMTLLDDQRQWFKSTLGVDLNETRIEDAFCAHALNSSAVMIVSDASRDPRFQNNPYVTGAPHIRFYAGAPLVTPDGVTLGTLCAIDSRPRELSSRQVECLSLLAKEAISLLEIRHIARRARQNAGDETSFSLRSNANIQLNKSLRLMEAIAQIIDQSRDACSTLSAVLNAVCLHTGSSLGHAWIPDAERLGQVAPIHLWCVEHPSQAGIYQESIPGDNAAATSDLTRQAMETGMIVSRPKLGKTQASPTEALLSTLGFASGFAVPIVGKELLGALEFYNRQPGPLDQSLLEVLHETGQLLGQALEREFRRGKLQDSEAYFRHLAEDSLDVTTILDADGTIRFESRSILHELGWEPLELAGHNAFEFVHPDDIADVAEAFQESLRTAGPTSLLRFRFRHKNGSYRYLEGRGNNLLANPAVRGVVFTCRDITEKKQLEKQFSQLAGGIAHDFNNLLTVVIGYSSSIQLDAATSEKTRHALIEVRHAAERAAGLTGQLLAFSGKQIMEPGNYKVDAMLEESCKSLGILLGEHTRLNFKPGAAGASIHVDRSQLDKVLLNIASNARDAMAGAGEIVLESRLETVYPTHGGSPGELPPGDYVVITLLDTGCGISTEARTHIFEPYFTTKTQGKGSGLSLASCQGIIQQSKGKILVHSEIGIGSRFSIYLPAIESERKDADTPTAARPVSGTRTILYAEDEESLRDLGVLVLEEAGYRVLAAENGLAALALLDAEPDLRPDLLLTDIMMPEMDGKALAEKVRARLPDTAILFCSGFAQHASFHQGIPERTHFLPKPYNVPTLLNKVAGVLEIA